MSKNMSRHLRLKHPKIFRSVRRHLDKPVSERTSRKISTSWVKGSWAKKYCQKVGENKYQCDLCEAILSLSKGLFGNMKRHIKLKHPYIYEKEVGGCRSDDVEEVEGVEMLTDTDDYLNEFIEDVKESIKKRSEKEGGESSGSEAESVSTAEFLNENDPEFDLKVKYLVTKQVSGKKRAKNCFWNFFNVIEENHLYCCLSCKRRVAIFPNSIANLKRHIRMKHKKQYEIMMKYMAEGSSGGNESPVSFDKYYFDLEGENDYKCKECFDVITCVDEDQQSLFDHIKDNHPDQILAYQEESLDNNDEFNVVVVRNDDD